MPHLSSLTLSFFTLKLKNKVVLAGGEGIVVSSLALNCISLMTNAIERFYRLAGHLDILIHKVDVQDYCP